MCRALPVRYRNVSILYDIVKQGERPLYCTYGMYRPTHSIGELSSSERFGVETDAKVEETLWFSRV